MTGPSVPVSASKDRSAVPGRTCREACDHDSRRVQLARHRSRPAKRPIVRGEHVVEAAVSGAATPTDEQPVVGRDECVALAGGEINQPGRDQALVVADEAACATPGIGQRGGNEGQASLRSNAPGWMAKIVGSLPAGLRRGKYTSNLRPEKGTTCVWTSMWVAGDGDGTVMGR